MGTDATERVYVLCVCERKKEWERTLVQSYAALTFVVKAACIDIAAIALAVHIVVFVQLLVQVLPRLIIPEEEQRRRK